MPAHQLPPPQAVALAGAELVEGGVLLQHLAISVQRVLTGFALGSVTGVLVGAFILRSRRVRMLLAPSITAVRSVPTTAWLPLLVLSLGIGEAPKVALIAIGAALPVFTAFVTAARAAGADEFPRRPVAAIVVGGLRLALTQSWVLVVAAELLHASTGLGFLLAESSATGRIDRLFVAIVLLALVARLTDGLLWLVDRRLARS